MKKSYSFYISVLLGQYSDQLGWDSPKIQSGLAMRLQTSKNGQKLPHYIPALMLHPKVHSFLKRCLHDLLFMKTQILLSKHFRASQS